VSEAARRTVAIELIPNGEPWWAIRCRPGCGLRGAYCMPYRRSETLQVTEKSCYLGGAQTRERAAAYAERLGYEVVA